MISYQEIQHHARKGSDSSALTAGQHRPESLRPHIFLLSLRLLVETGVWIGTVWYSETHGGVKELQV